MIEAVGSMKVLIGTTMCYVDFNSDNFPIPFFKRWLGWANNLTYPDAEVAVATDKGPTAQYISTNFPKIHVVQVDTMQGTFKGEPNVAILRAEGKDRVRGYVCNNPSIDWLLLTDGDLVGPPDTIERLMSIVNEGADMLWTTNIGAFFFMHRDICDSIHYWSTIIYREPNIWQEENFEVLRQLERANKEGGRTVYKVKGIRLDWLQHQDKALGVY
jgi:hypothetical protein